MSERPVNLAEISKDHALVHFFALMAAIEDIELLMRLLASGIASFLSMDAVALGFSGDANIMRVQLWHSGTGSDFRSMVAGGEPVDVCVSRALEKLGYPPHDSFALVHLGKKIGCLAVARQEPRPLTREQEFLLTSLQTLTSLLLAKHGTDEALRHSEQRVRLKLESILSPEGDVGELEMADIIDTPGLQALMDQFHELTRMPIGIIDLKGNVLVGVGWQDVCTKFHRVNRESCQHCVESDVQLSAGVPPGEFKLYHCENNMWDVATPITVGGKHVGNLFSGQFFFEGEPLDYELFRAQAQKYGFEEKAYLSALDRVGRLKRETVATGMTYLAKLAGMISKLSYSNIKLARSLAERQRAEEEIKRRNHVLDGISRIFQEALKCETEEELGQACLGVAEEITGSKFGFVAEIGADGLLHALAISDPGWEACSLQEQSGQRRAPGGFRIHGLYGRVLLDGRSLLSNAPAEHPDSIGTPAGHPPLSSFLGVPLFDARRVVGMIAVANRGGGYRQQDLETLESLAPAVLEALQRKRTEQALIRSEKLVSVGRLAATIAHEINNPLEAATNALYILGRDRSLAGRSREMVDIADRELRRAAQIARRTLGFYREPNSRRSVVIAELLQELTSVYESQMKAKDVSLRVRCADESAAILGNAGEIRQLFSNLLANSIDAVGAAGTVHVRVGRRSLATGTPTVRITVADTGTGIQKQNLKRIFEPFFTTKKDVGTGLGLWITEQIVKKQGGTIRVRSQVGRGTVFSVRLPAATALSASAGY